ncbi:MAG: BamA/TamA family outer membrane protein [Myxococcales bacterium]|nr:BamA/TamA family outer membrane protein [Myxococcales bacterium]
MRAPRLASVSALLVSSMTFTAPARAQVTKDDAGTTSTGTKGASDARRDQQPDEAKQAEKRPSYTADPDAPIPGDGERAVPDYDGRPDRTTAGDVLIWIPRILLSPLYLVSEYVIRRPLGVLVTTAERDNWVEAVTDFFTFGPDDNMGIVPTGLIDFGFRPSVGVYYFWNDAGHQQNKVRARAAWGGEDWLNLQLTDRVALDEDTDISLTGEYLKRPDYVFYGLGPRSRGPDPRYRREMLEAKLGFSGYLTTRPHHKPRTPSEQPTDSMLQATVGVRDVTIGLGDGCCDDPSVQSLVDEGRLETPPGSRDGYTIAFERLDLDLDSRRRREKLFDDDASDWTQPNGTGVRFSVRAEHATGLRRPTPTLATTTTDRQAWLKYGATLGAFWDVTDLQRVLGLQLIVDLVDPLLDGSEIPFNEQINLGGDRPMRGFLEGRLIDRSSAVLRFDYTWPIWVWLDGAVHYAVGNVFGEHLEGFEAGALRQSAGMGIRAVGSRDHVFEMLLAFGTEPFDEGAEPESLRFVFGATSGF